MSRVLDAHLKMDRPDERRCLDDMAQGIVGTPADRVEGPLKVAGRATYAHEWAVENLAHGVLVRAPFAHGTITEVGADAVRSLPGILGVFADERLLRHPAQGGADEAPPQGAAQVVYFGQPVALVVAESFEQARHGAQALRLAYEAEPAVVDPEADDVEIDRPADDQFDQGDLERALREAAFAVDQTYRTPGHNSAAMEPHASIAEWQDDTLLLRGSYQMLKHNRLELADALGIAPERVRILSPYVGGGFGSKLGIAPEAVAAALAARHLGRPVAVALTRQQVFEATMRRAETRQRIRLAADRDGRLTGIGHDVLTSNLPGESFSESAAQATHFLYRGDNRRVIHEVARVRRTCAGSVRAPGEAVGVQALEIAMDELAEQAGIDPVELRKRNIPERDPERDVPFSSRRFAEALDEGAARFGWSRRRATPGAIREGEWLIGLGMAAAVRVNQLSESKARVTLRPDASAVIETDMTDIGTGTYTILAQIAAEMLGLPLAAVETRLGDTDLPPAAGSGGSWGASSAGSSVFLACEALRGKLAAKLDCAPEALTLTEGTAIVGNRRIAVGDLLNGEPMAAEGHIEPGEAEDKVRQATFGAHFAEVAVSAVTGETRLRRMLGCYSAGRILNPKTARSQCYGGMIFGIGIALTEALQHDARDGHIVNRDFADYHLPVHLDVPPLEVHLLDERDDWASPLQSKGIGELSICGAAAAVVNAIYNACGVRVRDLPATLDKVLAGLEEAGR